MAAPCVPGTGVCGRRQWYAVYDLWRGEYQTKVLQDLSDVRRSIICGRSSFCTLSGRLLVFLSLAGFCSKPFWKSLFQYQSSRRELLLVGGADCASPFSRGVRIGSQWSDERVEDILEERDHRRTIGVVVRESDLEAEDGVGVWAWRFRRVSAKRADRYAHTNNENTFAHEQHSRPQ